MCVCRSNWLLLCPSHRFWSQQIRNYILTVLGEEWDQGGRSPLREIQPRPPRPRNNTHWVHFPQPATPCWPNASFLLLFYFSSSTSQTFCLPCHQTATKKPSVQGSIMFFSLKLFLTVRLVDWLNFAWMSVFKKKKKKSEWCRGSFCVLYVCFLPPPVSCVWFSCHFVEVGSAHPSYKLKPCRGVKKGVGGGGGLAVYSKACTVWC